MDFAPIRCPASATEYTSIAMLLVYPFVRRISRFSLLRSHAYRNINQSPSFQFTGPPFPTRCCAGGSHSAYTE